MRHVHGFRLETNVGTSSWQRDRCVFICELKRRFGGKITLWGGVSLEKIIGGSAQDVRADVRRAMECAKPGGRFILGTSHSIAVGSNYDNFMAMLDEYHRTCYY